MPIQLRLLALLRSPTRRSKPEASSSLKLSSSSQLHHPPLHHHFHSHYHCYCYHRSRNQRNHRRHRGSILLFECLICRCCCCRCGRCRNLHRRSLSLASCILQCMFPSLLNKCFHIRFVQLSLFDDEKE